MEFTIICFLGLILSINCKTIEVSSAQQLVTALGEVSAGDTIHLHDGQYHGHFESSKSGNSGSSITLTGSKSAVLSGANYGFWLKGSHWVLKGFSVSGAKKGIVLEGASHCILDGLDVGNIEEEGIHFRKSSADNILRNSHVHNTGTTTPGFGEGVYIGQAVSCGPILGQVFMFLLTVCPNSSTTGRTANRIRAIGIISSTIRSDPMSPPKALTSKRARVVVLSKVIHSMGRV